MKREEFEHVIRAAYAIVKEEIVVIGSQAVLAQYPDAPETLLMSSEVDLFPRDNPARSEEIDGAIGDGSRFHQTYAYYAHGVGPETVVGPAGWTTNLSKRRSVQAWSISTNCVSAPSLYPIVIASQSGNG